MSGTDASVTGEPLTEQMWQEVMVQLRTFVRRRIADPQRAEDIVGDILLRIHQTVGSVHDRERLTQWVSRVAHNAIIDEYRRGGRRREQLTPTIEDAAIDADGESVTVPYELAGCLRPLLAGLPPEQRRAVEMVDLDGMPQADAAHREDVSVSGMKSRVQRGRRRLAELLGRCCALTLDARGVPMDYTPAPGCAGSCGCGRAAVAAAAVRTHR
jgi:RNA polymerase sigma-70 factor (ECF subfamily)